jgi:uncharacterized protein (DUF927 family)
MPSKKAGKAAIKKAIDEAEDVPAKPANDTNFPADMPNVRVSGGCLMMDASGLHKQHEGGGKQKITGPFDVTSQTRDDDAVAWGLMMRFRDPDGVMQHVVVRRDLFAGEGGDLRTLLARRGLYINPEKPVRGLLEVYLSNISTDRRSRIVNRTGWHRIDGTTIFVLPGRVFGTPPVEVIYQPAINDASRYSAEGTLSQWREEVASLCQGNPRLMLGVSTAFAGPLLDIANQDGGGLHLRGGSRIGKTTVLYGAASVWGGDVSAGAAAYIQHWRSTDNAMEGMAFAHSDTLLPLDELGQADARTVGDMAYLLASGQGKARSDRAGGLRSPVRFRVLFLSTGELSLSDKIAEAGRRVKAGQEVRVVNIPADAGKNLGIFEDIHGAAGAESFVLKFRAATTRSYGTAGPAFLDYLVAEVARGPELGERIREWTKMLAGEWMAANPGATGQVGSVANRFALIAVAGELATEDGITGWEKGDATEAAKQCLDAWLRERGTVRAREDTDAVAQLHDFVMHGIDRFQVWRDPSYRYGEDGRLVLGADGRPETLEPKDERYRIPNRAGWKRKQADSIGDPHVWHYYLTSQAMKEALSGLDQRQAHRVLIDRGFLLPGAAGRPAGSFTPPGHSKVRLYHVLPKIESGEED